jgi:hypothetical protein
MQKTTSDLPLTLTYKGFIMAVTLIIIAVLDEAYINFRRDLLFLMIKSLLLWTFVVFVFTSSEFHLYKHPESAAKCLDGSPPALYFSSATGSGNKDKFIILFEGGSSCMGSSLSSVLDDCVKRSKTHLGSSAKYPDK